MIPGAALFSGTMDELKGPTDIFRAAKNADANLITLPFGALWDL